MVDNQADASEQTCANYLKALGDATRLRIVRALQMGPLSVSDLAELLEHDLGGVSHHLRVLYHADIVETRREGKYIYYSLNPRWLGQKRRKPRGILDFGCCKLDVREH